LPRRGKKDWSGKPGFRHEVPEMRPDPPNDSPSIELNFKTEILKEARSFPCFYLYYDRQSFKF
jgi:hypothetical protein